VVTARTLAEARLYARSLGRHVVTAERVGDRAMLTVVDDGDLRHEEIALSEPDDGDRHDSDGFGRGPSTLIRRDTFDAFAESLERGLPRDAAGLPAEVIGSLLQEVGLAIAAREQSKRLGNSDFDVESLRALAKGYSAARAGAAPTRAISDLAVPSPGAKLLPATRAKVESALRRADLVEMLLSGSLGEWRVFADERAKRRIASFRHIGGAVVQVELGPEGRATAAQLLQGGRAIEVWVPRGFVLGPEERARLDAALRQGAPWKAALESAVGSEGKAVPRQLVQGPLESWVIAEVWLRNGPAERSGLVVLLLDRGGTLRGHRVIDGAVGWSFLATVREAQRAVPSGGQSTQDRAQEAGAVLDTIARSAAPLLDALRRGDPRAVASVEPRVKDATEAFQVDAVPLVLAGYATPRHWPSIPETHTQLTVAASTGGALRFPNAHSASFRGDFLRVADRLQPGRTWLSWAWSDPEAGSEPVVLDGLVWVGKRWVAYPDLPEVLSATVPPPMGPITGG
jgi:hypothetical protein